MGPQKGERRDGRGVRRAFRRTLWPLSALLPLFLIHCATPVAPTGGPVDQTAPRLVASSPDADAVGVDSRTVRLSFSERIDAATALRAVRVTPENAPGEPAPVVEASADEIVVTLPDLRDSTTYVVTVGTDLADRRGVKLSAPITLAFSTGPTLDRGEVGGTVRLPTDGSGVASLSVLAWRIAGDTLPDPRTDRPDARTETDAQGAFRLGYLRDTPHFVAALRDLNRNGRADDGEPFAVAPDPRVAPAIRAAPSASEDSLDRLPDLLAPLDSVVFPARDAAPPAAARPASLDLWLARRDTVPPEVRTVRAISNRRFRVRFSEGLDVDRYASGGSAWSSAFVTDSVDARIAEAEVYAVPGEPREVEIWAEKPLPPGPARLYTVVLDSVGLATTDRARGLSTDGLWAVLDVPERADTLRTRVLGFEPSPLSPDSAATFQAFARDDALEWPSGGSWPTVLLSGPSDGPVTVLSWARSGRVAPPDTLRASGFAIRPRACSVPAATIEACADPVPPREIVVVGAGAEGTARFDIPTEDDLGSLSGRVPSASSLPTTARLRIEITTPAGETRQTTVVNEAYSFAGLAPGAYSVRAFLDLPDPLGDWNQQLSGRWVGGSLAPYLPPEPLVILAEPVEVRARWETEIDAALLAPLFDAADFAGTPPPAPDR